MKSKLNEIQFYVTQKSGTEPPFSGNLLYNNKHGFYYCICCNSKIFSSEDKLYSLCGWPSFIKTVDDSLVKFLNDDSYGMHRIEVLCNLCNAHLGHVFYEDDLITIKRYCINSVSLQFIDKNSGKIIIG